MFVNKQHHAHSAQSRGVKTMSVTFALAFSRAHAVHFRSKRAC